jgi:hypothetical protein
MNPKRGTLSIAPLILGSLFMFGCGADNTGRSDGSSGVDLGEAENSIQS